ncbi:major facilitator superfamily domain-containing protein [Phyllosticta paracitricarpa]|uniref:Major facilitator superfamily domain-containing protein n=1 Tax=Phyllosticta paracitricarpa TaxID=2016321 RepID=A0ABR1N383_9PEZI
MSRESFSIRQSPRESLFLEHHHDANGMISDPSHTSPASASSQQSQDPERADGSMSRLDEGPPDGGYGWVCTICAFLINAHTAGVNSSWAIFLDYFVSHHTYPDATRWQYALIGGLSISQSLIVSPVISVSNHFLGVRFTMVFGAVIVFLSMLAASYATEVWHLFLTQGFLFGWGTGFLYITATSMLPLWFSSRQSLAVGFAASGAGIGGLGYTLAAGYLVNEFGVAWTYRFLAYCSLVFNLISAVLLKERGKALATEHRAFVGLKEFRRPEVLLIFTWGFLTQLGYISLLYSLPSYATSIGLTARQGSLLGALLNLGLGVGRPIIGYYSDAYGRINMALGMTVLCSLLCLVLWTLANSYGLLAVFAMASGAVCGTFWSAVPPILADVVGIQNFASSFGMLCFSLVLPTTFADSIAMALIRGTGEANYIPSQIFVGTMFVSGAVFLASLRAWKVWQCELRAPYADDQTSSLTSSTSPPPPPPSRSSQSPQIQGPQAQQQQHLPHQQLRSPESAVPSQWWLTPKRMFALKRI